MFRLASLTTLYRPKLSMTCLNAPSATRCLTKTTGDSAVLPDGQMRFSTNKKWHAAMNFIPKPRDIPVYQYPVVLGSAVVCLIYFCFLREENELDRILAGEVSVLDRDRQTSNKQPT